MNAIKIPEAICSYFGEHGIALSPEVWRETGDGKASALFLSGGRNTVSEYIDGTRVIDVGFEIRLRTRAASLRDRLDAIEFYRRIDEAVRAKNDGEFTLRILSGGTKSAIFDSGEEEYRASYAIRYSEK